LVDAELKNFVQNLGLLASIKEIALDFSGCPSMKDEQLAILGLKLKELTFLRTFAFGFYSNPGSLTFYDDFYSSRNEQNQLNLPITDTGMYFILESLKNLESLIDLRISFHHWNVYDKGDLWKPLPLTNMKLNFSGWDITDEELRSLAESIQKSTNINQVKLDFEGCRRITSTGINYLVHCLRDLDPVNPLEAIILNFSNCQGLNHQDLDLKSDYFEHFRKLERIDILFEGCDFPAEFLKQLQKDFEKLPQVRDVFIAERPSEK